MKGFTSPLWPIRYRPLPDELLSCWLVRLAHGHGLKVQTFCHLIFGSQRQIWNRDIDRLAPYWMLDELSLRTGISPSAARRTTLHDYHGYLYAHYIAAGILDWILTQKMYHRKRQGFGLQYCPQCLSEDLIPYFRKSWRLALNTVCIKHGNMLHDRCPSCGQTIVFHRLDMTKRGSIDDIPLAICADCGFDLRDSPIQNPICYDQKACRFLLQLNQEIMQRGRKKPKHDLSVYLVMRHLTRMMVGKYQHLHLREFVLDQINAPDIALGTGYIAFEMRPLVERHHLLQLTAWLMVDLETRLEMAWRARAIRYNLLLRDFSDAPDWYRQIVGKFSNWRDRC